MLDNRYFNDNFVACLLIDIHLAELYNLKYIFFHMLDNRYFDDNFVAC